ncbi:MAG: ABC transporter ATP-binding protein [Bacteroidota bacterium]|nr:ABC transporter ATP-binding protein [Rhodothermia bacterium]MDW8137223.1 ABC transporter ATP-binding protein [Bacteroidota bacterium]MDW8284907.1 ABC transporter ATP-binding protein [Bacteroidota bacterium]
MQVRLAGVTKSYPMGRTSVRALRGVDLEIHPGQFVLLVGRSGSGKSTLLHLIAAMDRPSAGTIAVGPWQLDRLTAKEQASYRRQTVGMIFQGFHLIPTMTARENVELPLLLAGWSKRERLRRADALLELVGLRERSAHRPTELSGGEQQRVAIARALALNPPLLLADEPTGNLDSHTAAEVLQMLARVHREEGKTVILVTHDVAEAQPFAQRLVRLQDGAVIEDVSF